MKRNTKLALALFSLAITLMMFGAGASALGSSQNPQSGSLGLEATIPSAPPSTAASIGIPSNGQSFTSIPITVGGLCPSNLLIKVDSNNVFVGSTICTNGSYSLKVDLFNGSNTLNAQDFDSLGQGGPLSNNVNVTFVSGQYTQPGSQVVVTSNYDELGANPGQQLSWPITIGGGVPPYAISVDWGDGPPVLQSSALGGKVDINHTYAASGIYTITVTVSDSKGSTGFLQLVGVANGKVTTGTTTSSGNGSSANKTNTSKSTSIPWWVFAIIAGALVPTFWLGSRHGRAVLARKYQ